MSQGLAVYNQNGTAVFDSGRGDKIQRTVYTTTTGTSSGSVNVPQFDSDHGHVVAYPISGKQFSENPRVTWNNSTKTLSWNFYHSNKASARIFLVMYGGTPTTGSFGMYIADEDGNSLIDTDYQCLAQIHNYTVSGGTKPSWRERNIRGFIFWDHTWNYVSHSTVPSNQDEADFENEYMLGAKLPTNGILFPSNKDQNTVEHSATGSGLEVMKFGIRKTMPTNSDFGLLFQNTSGNRIIFTDQDRYPEVVQTWEFDTLPTVSPTTGAKLRLTHESVTNGYYIVYFNATPLIHVPPFNYGGSGGSTHTEALGIKKINDTTLDVGFFNYGRFTLTNTAGNFGNLTTSRRFLIPQVADNSNMDLFLRISLLRLRT